MRSESLNSHFSLLHPPPTQAVKEEVGTKERPCRILETHKCTVHGACYLDENCLSVAGALSWLRELAAKKDGRKVKTLVREAAQQKRQQITHT